MGLILRAPPVRGVCRDPRRSDDARRWSGRRGRGRGLSPVLGRQDRSQGGCLQLFLGARFRTFEVNVGSEIAKYPRARLPGEPFAKEDSNLIRGRSGEAPRWWGRRPLVVGRALRPGRRWATTHLEPQWACSGWN